MPPSRQAYRNRRPNGNGTEVSGALGAGASKINKKIRDIERSLKRENIPATIRTEKERALKALHVELKNVQLNLKQRDIARKYHMVRFFERKKAMRKLKQARKEHDDVSKTEIKKDIKKIRKKLRHCEVDLAYVVYFPKDEKYISLYPNAKTAELDEKSKKGLQSTEKRRAEFKKEVETLLDANKLPFGIDDIVAGKASNLDTNYNLARLTEEPDAPDANYDEAEEEEDDFFE